MATQSIKEIKEKITPGDFLAKLGRSVVRKSGGDHFYYSIFREERSPSLSVNGNMWFDFGGGNASNINGGNLIDLAMAWWHPIGMSEAVSRLSQMFEHDLNVEKPLAPAKAKPMVKSRNYQIDNIGSLGNTFGITSYLQQRAIWGVADGEVYEIHYHVSHEKARKNFFAAGWQNENGGWEVRNKYFKGCLGAKGMSFIKKPSEKLLVFEGYMDYLSYKFEQEEVNDNVLVLNSVVFLYAAIHRSKEFNLVEIYFDHDTAGLAATDKFIKAQPVATDCSIVYKGFKDYNDKVCHDIRKFIRENQKQFRPFGNNMFSV